MARAGSLCVYQCTPANGFTDCEQNNKIIRSTTNTTSPMCRPRGRLLLALLLALLLVLLRAHRRRKRVSAVRQKFEAILARVRLDVEILRLRAHASKIHVPPQEIAFPAEVDVVISGGGFWSIYAGAVCFVLKQHGIRIRRASGTSAGAHTALLVQLGCEEIDEGFLWAIAVTETLRDVGAHVFLEDLWTRFFQVRVEPPPADGELLVGISEASLSGSPFLRQRRLDTFADGEHLLDALVATARIPGFFGLARHRRSQRYRFALDGSATCMCPLFRDGERPQLVLHWDELRERFGKLSGFGLPASTIYELGYLGVDAACRLLRGETRVAAASLVRPAEKPPPIAGAAEAVIVSGVQAVRRVVRSLLDRGSLGSGLSP
jgi:hypothetical protein